MSSRLHKVKAPSLYAVAANCIGGYVDKTANTQADARSRQVMMNKRDCSCTTIVHCTDMYISGNVHD
jgi:hypothetical protein